MCLWVSRVLRRCLGEGGQALNLLFWARGSAFICYIHCNFKWYFTFKMIHFIIKKCLHPWMKTVWNIIKEQWGIALHIPNIQGWGYEEQWFILISVIIYLKTKYWIGITVCSVSCKIIVILVIFLKDKVQKP